MTFPRLSPHFRSWHKSKAPFNSAILTPLVSLVFKAPTVIHVLPQKLLLAKTVFTSTQHFDQLRMPGDSSQRQPK